MKTLLLSLLLSLGIFGAVFASNSANTLTITTDKTSYNAPLERPRITVRSYDASGALVVEAITFKVYKKGRLIDEFYSYTSANVANDNGTYIVYNPPSKGDYTVNVTSASGGSASVTFSYN